MWTNTQGDVYEGQFQKDKKTGLGQFNWANGNVYKGQFKNDMREGEGEMTWNDGSHYQGDWKKGVPNGLGTEFIHSGTFTIQGQPPRHGLFEHNILIK